MLNLTENAQAAVQKFIEGSAEPVDGLRVSVTGGGCSGFQYGMSLAAAAEDSDTIVECGPVKVFIDPESAPMLDGITIDYLDGLEGTGFKFENPNATSSCGCGSSFSC